jgi:hypothetical protein
VCSPPAHGPQSLTADTKSVRARACVDQTGMDGSVRVLLHLLRVVRVSAPLCLAASLLTHGSGTTPHVPPFGPTVDRLLSVRAYHKLSTTCHCNPIVSIKFSSYSGQLRARTAQKQCAAPAHSCVADNTHL